MEFFKVYEKFESPGNSYEIYRFSNGYGAKFIKEKDYSAIMIIKFLADDSFELVYDKESPDGVIKVGNEEEKNIVLIKISKL